MSCGRGEHRGGQGPGSGGAAGWHPSPLSNLQGCVQDLFRHKGRALVHARKQLPLAGLAGIRLRSALARSGWVERRNRAGGGQAQRQEQRGVAWASHYACAAGLLGAVGLAGLAVGAAGRAEGLVSSGRRRTGRLRLGSGGAGPAVAPTTHWRCQPVWRAGRARRGAWAAGRGAPHLECGGWQAWWKACVWGLETGCELRGRRGAGGRLQRRHVVLGSGTHAGREASAPRQL